MGVDFLNGRGMEAVPYPVAASARALTGFLNLPQNARTECIRTILIRARNDGRERMMIYCNTLCSAVDMEALSEELRLPLITPMMVYRQYAVRYGVLGVMAGSNQSLAKIERALREENENCVVLGFGNQLLVEAIEAGTDPAELMEQFGLPGLTECFRKAGAEAILLGCTHFPCLSERLSACAEIPVLDPAERMYELLVS
jgi:glutamate racemase